jgi:hypothetical protein
MQRTYATVRCVWPALCLASPCYLARSDGALAVSHLRLAADEETFSQYVTPPAELHATLAGACLGLR